MKVVSWFGRLPRVTGIDPRPVHLRFLANKMALEEADFGHVFPYQYHSTNAPHSCPYQNGKQVKSRNLKKSNAVSDIGEALDRNVATFTLFLLLKVSNFVKCAHGITHKKSANYSICESFLRPLYKTECPYI